MQCRHKKNLTTTSSDCKFSFSITVDLSQMVLPTIFVFASINLAMSRTSPCGKERSPRRFHPSVSLATIGTTHLNSSRFSTMFAVICFFLSQSHHVAPKSRFIVLFIVISKVIFSSWINLRNQAGNKFPKKTLFISLLPSFRHNFFPGKESINYSKAKNFKLNACLPASSSPDTRQM